MHSPLIGYWKGESDGCLKYSFPMECVFIITVIPINLQQELKDNFILIFEVV